MALTAEQIAEISAQLSVDLSLQTDDRLIELCLLYRSAPSALPSFVGSLGAEILRRFTAAEIATNDVMFSVLQNFSNQFGSLYNYQDKLYKLSTTDANLRDDWFRNNATFFYDVLHNAEALTWLSNQTELIEYVLTSPVAFDAVFSSSFAIDTFVNSTVAMTAVIASSVTMTAVASSSVAMTVVASSTTAMTAVISSTTAMIIVAASSVAMTAVALSTVAMTVVAASTVALSKIVVSTSARNALMSNNTILQDVRQAMYSTITTNWVKKAGLNSGAITDGVQMTIINNGITTPQGFVFATLGKTYSSGGAKAVHPNGSLAVNKVAGNVQSPTSLLSNDVVTFDNAKFSGSTNGGQAFAELWSPI